MMTQTLTAPTDPVAPDYNSTLVLAIELSNASWVLAAQESRKCLDLQTLM